MKIPLMASINFPPLYTPYKANAIEMIPNPIMKRTNDLLMIRYVTLLGFKNNNLVFMNAIIVNEIYPICGIV